jgi:gluconate 2-dehydrogenase gamma chain
MSQSPDNLAGESSQASAYRYLMEVEARFLDAAVSRLIPADELGPGALEAGATYFIDQQLAGSWGTHGRNYRMGPWQEGTPQQGFQSPLTPQEIYRAAVREINIYCTKQYDKNFSFLKPEQQDEILHALESDNIELPSVSAKLFFGLLWRNTQEGFLSDPIYGGNRDKIGWKLIGFPGVAAFNYTEYMEKDKYNVPYRVEPVSILDIVQNRVRVDAQGYPKHVMLDQRDKK